jgi:hypothetical protein
MQIRHAGIATLVLAAGLVSASCDGESPSAYPVRANSMTLQWCPAPSQLTWTLDVGLAPYEATDSAPLEWPGGYFYSVMGPNWGAGGGAGRISCCAHPSSGCGLPVEQQQATRWVVSDTVRLDDAPTAFSVRLGVRMGHQPDRFVPGTSALDLRVDLGPPAPVGTSGCQAIPVVAITEVEVAPDLE